MRTKNALSLFFMVYVVGLSFIPLIHQVFLGENRWSGYGTGAYAFQSQQYYVLFNDPSDGSSKPNIHINPSFAPNARISLAEFSDWTSWVNGYNLFNDFNATIRTDQRFLDITYTRPGTTMHKFIGVSPDGTSVTVKLTSDKEFAAHLEIWKWVMTSINGYSIKQAPKPFVIGNTTMISYSFPYQPLNAIATVGLSLSRVPSQIEIWPFEDGFNKITVDFVNSEMALTVQGTMVTTGGYGFEWSYTDLPYVLPLVAIFVVALFLLVGKYGKHKKHRPRRSSR